MPYNLSVVQRAFLVPYFGIQAILDPTKGDMVAGLGDVLGEGSAKRILRRMQKCPRGRKILENKPVISSKSVSKSELEKQPDGSLGKMYLEYMQKHRFDM